uniref:ViKr35P n=1 Tax=Conus virgo TaxID=89427 RepID=Q3YED4_CONVR|nr:ViKr35P [Conus virgo]
MKLTCVIVAVLFLTACQLTTAGDSRDKEGYRAVRSILSMQDGIDSRECRRRGQGCTQSTPCCDGLRCDGQRQGGMCVDS